MDSEAQHQETNASAFTCHIQNHLNTISGVLPIENIYMFFPQVFWGLWDRSKFEAGAQIDEVLMALQEAFLQILHHPQTRRRTHRVEVPIPTIPEVDDRTIYMKPLIYIRGK